ncbi:MAG: substrate-binding domain-containing protein [SAR324 cluster bacterium]|nr:substrate-binding domain-containing protein [SAR324 cluster bacterium]
MVGAGTDPAGGDRAVPAAAGHGFVWPREWWPRERWARERWARAALILCLHLLAAAPLEAGERFLTLASTTSTENSGLFAHILPLFEADTGIAVRVVARGTGQALRLARNGDADVVLVHDRESELAFQREGWGVERREVMYNDFVLLGPSADAAGIRGKPIAQALRLIFNAGARFVSRADESGTHKAEIRLWRAAGLQTPVGSEWYLETGSGMGATLNIASAMNAYALADRATWLAFQNKGQLDILVQGDPVLINPYGIMLVNPQRHPHVKAEEGRALIAWLTSARGRKAIAQFKVAGQQLFHPYEP